MIGSEITRAILDGRTQPRELGDVRPEWSFYAWRMSDGLVQANAYHVTIDDLRRQYRAWLAARVAEYKPKGSPP